MDMDPVTDDLCHNILIIKNSTYDTWCTMRKRRHCVIQMDCMVCSCSACFHCCIVICIGMCQRNIDPFMNFPDKFCCMLTFFRCNPYKFYQTFRGL